MKKTIFTFLLSILLTGQLFAQQGIFKVQGIPRIDLNNKQDKRLKTASSDEMYDYNTFSLDSVKFWVGTGENRAALIIDWYDGKGTETAMVWGYRWHKDSVRCGLDMVNAIAKADKRFLFLTHYTGGMGNTVSGLGYDLNNSGNQSLIFENDTDNPHYPVNGVVTTTEYNYDSWKNSDSEDHWQAGWYEGYWSYQVKEASDESFSYSGLGASSRILKNGSLDAWGYQDFNAGGGMFDGVLPRMPFVYVESPYLPFPNYSAYWGHIRKNTESHMPIVNAPLAIKQESLIEKWKLTGIGGMTQGGQTLIINNNLYLVHNNKLKIINRETGATLKETTMAANAGFFSMMAYGEGKIFVPLANGVMQAFRADNLESIWKTETINGKQQLCEVTYHDGYVYTGMWQGGGTGTFYCVKAEDEDPADKMEIKPRLWESFNKGYYWSGGTIVDNAIVFGGDLGALESRDRLTGELLDSIQITGTIRCGTSYDVSTRRIFFTAKEEKKVYSVTVNTDGTFNKISLKSGDLSGQATTVPVLYNGRLYVTSGTMTSGGGLDIIDASTLKKIYSVNIGGISQANPLVSTAYATPENNYTVYIYLTLNNANGSIVCVKDFEDNTESIVKYSIIPSSKQYCTHSLLADELGIMYYKNDAGVLIAYDNKPSYEVDAVMLNVHEKTLIEKETTQLVASILPVNADNKNVTWKSIDPTIASVDENGLVTANGVGQTKIVVTAVDGDLTDTCAVIVKAMYTEGVFFVNEDWFGHQNSSLNFLSNNGQWVYNAYERENPGKQLGCTSQYGAIYGGRLFITSKQAQDPGASIEGSRFAVADATTLQSQAEFTQIDVAGDNADGRAFLGVDEHKGYISTNNGIWIYDIDNAQIIGQLDGTASTGGLYSGQTGTMLRVGNRVFAVNQSSGVMVIDANSDGIETIINAPFENGVQRGYGSIVLSKDGSLWLSVTSNTSGNGNAEDYMLMLNPYTLDTTRVALPAGESIPNSWYAWTADGFCSSKNENKLYWKNNGGWFTSTKIYVYDIDKNETSVLLDLANYDDGGWGLYGAGFRVNPETNDIYASLFREFLAPIYRTIKFNQATGNITTYEMDDHYWFPAMPVFPDNYAPVVSDDLTDLSIDKEIKISLGDKVDDVDNMSAAIVKSIVSISNKDLLTATIQNDSLIISPRTGQFGNSEIELQFNSNGKIVSKTITITIEDFVISVYDIELNTSTLTLSTNSTYQLIATILPENATNKNVKWDSSNPAIATVSENGLITAIADGEANITVTTEDGELSDICVVTVSTSTSVTDLIKGDKAKVYPTITTGQITIVQEKTIGKVQILNISGQLLQTFDIDSLEGTIDIGSYQAGLYLVKIGNQVVKVIKK